MATYRQTGSLLFDFDHADQRQIEDAVAAGVLELDGDQAPARMTCPACSERVKRPPRFGNDAEMLHHYAERHPGLVVPDWKDDEP